jgi:hypothetical protein
MVLAHAMNRGVGVADLAGLGLQLAFVMRLAYRGEPQCARTSNYRRRSGRCSDRSDVAYETGRRDALVDPLDGRGNWLFPHHDPPDLGGVRLAAAP